MNIGEELDRLVVEGRVTSLVLGCNPGMAQVYVKLGRVDTYVHHRAGTASAALAGAIEKVPSTEAYDLKYSAQAVSERAQQDNPSSANGRPAEMTNDGSTPSEGAKEPAGVFD